MAGADLKFKESFATVKYNNTIREITILFINISHFFLNQDLLLLACKKDNRRLVIACIGREVRVNVADEVNYMIIFIIIK